MKHWNVITHLVKNCGFGSQAKLAKLLGISESYVSDLKRNNMVPANLQIEIIKLGKAEGNVVTPNDFFPPELRSVQGTQDQVNA